MRKTIIAAVAFAAIAAPAPLLAASWEVAHADICSAQAAANPGAGALCEATCKVNGTCAGAPQPAAQQPPATPQDPQVPFCSNQQYCGTWQALPQQPPPQNPPQFQQALQPPQAPVPDCGNQDTSVPTRIGDGPWICAPNGNIGIRG
jgi:hypothetical protein